MKKIFVLFAVIIIIAYIGCRSILYNDYSNEKAVEYLVKHAETRSKSRCALYVRRAISAGGALHSFNQHQPATMASSSQIWDSHR